MASPGTRELVRRFYADAWNRWDDLVPERILAADFVFRGSLGDEVRGREGWRSYRDRMRAAIPDFHNEIVDVVVDGDRAAARLRYSGHHHGELLGVPGRGRRIKYAGAAFFTAQDGFLTTAWVLGDLDGLRRQLP
ncbi:ester cyclase [Amycolatopsis alkalitolerans]|uniref:ester cyclase n=1 Tax=Amycolatopsis alkalitolerans TaxID=2547244 RepID=UPI001359AA85|nr:ester cyclase [Amycolatopsis alkalitolerans]